MSSQAGPIVVGYDRSQTSREALDWAVAEAVREQASLRIAEVFELIIETQPAEGKVVPLDALRVNRERGLEVVAEGIRLRHPGLAVGAVLLQDTPSPALIAESEKARMVVLGSRGMGGWDGMLIGSVGVQVAGHAHCPVVVVPPGVRPRAHDKPTVVVGVDGSKLSEQAIDFAFRHADAHGYRLLAVHAWHSPAGTYEGGHGPLMFDRAEIEAAAELLVAKSVAGAMADHPDVEVETRLINGKPARALLSSAESADLVVVGSRGRGGFTGLLLGSVSQGVLHHAHCPVAIVR